MKKHPMEIMALVNDMRLTAQQIRTQMWSAQGETLLDRGADMIVELMHEAHKAKQEAA